MINYRRDHVYPIRTPATPTMHTTRTTANSLASAGLISAIRGQDMPTDFSKSLNVKAPPLTWATMDWRWLRASFRFSLSLLVMSTHSWGKDASKRVQRRKIQVPKAMLHHCETQNAEGDKATPDMDTTLGAFNLRQGLKLKPTFRAQPR